MLCRTRDTQAEENDSIALSNEEKAAMLDTVNLQEVMEENNMR